MLANSSLFKLQPKHLHENTALTLLATGPGVISLQEISLTTGAVHARPVSLPSKAFPCIWAFGMELGSTATAEEFLTTLDFPSLAENLQVREAGEFFYSRSVLLKVYSKCKSQR